MTLPNFFIIGAAKSGTSSLYMYLKQHPQIYMSPVKEPHFFSYDSKSKITSGPGDTVVNAISDFEEYTHLFDNVQNEIAVGEASPTYLYREEAPKRIQKLIPKAKIICVLRNPIYRAYSAFTHLVRDNREETRDFKKALDLEKERISKNWGPLWHYVNCGMYYEQLKRYYDLFDNENILVILQEDLLTERKKTLISIFNFLGVDPDFEPNTSVKYNMSGYPKNEFVHKVTRSIFNGPNPIRWITRKVLPKKTRSKIKREINQKNLIRKEIPENIKLELSDEFTDDIKSLEKLINRDLSHWIT